MTSAPESLSNLKAQNEAVGGKLQMLNLQTNIRFCLCSSEENPAHVLNRLCVLDLHSVPVSSGTSQISYQ